MADDDTLTTKLNHELGLSGNSGDIAIKLYHCGEEFLIKEADLPFIIGRDQDSCHLTVDSKKASRNHCTITLEQAQIGVLDTSKNGTVVKVGSGDPIVIRNSFFPLSGGGQIKLGDKIMPEDTKLIMYKVVKIQE